jgi:transposase
LWVATTEELVVYRIDASKGREAFQKLLGVDFPGIVGSDRAKAYDRRDPRLRQVCWAHLDRNFQKLYDSGGQGQNLARAFLFAIDDLFAFWHQYQQGTRSKEQFLEKLTFVKTRFRDLLDLGMADNLATVHEICESLNKLWDALWTFSRVDGVEPTNNSAERAGRPAVTLRKTSLGSQSERGNQFVQRVLTAVETLKKQGRNAYGYLVVAIDAAIRGVEAPSLLPVIQSG